MGIVATAMPSRERVAACRQQRRLKMLWGERRMLSIFVVQSANEAVGQVCPLAEHTPSLLRTEAMLLSGRTRASSRINCSVAASVFERCWPERFLTNLESGVIAPFPMQLEPQAAWLDDDDLLENSAQHALARLDRCSGMKSTDDTNSRQEASAPSARPRRSPPAADRVRSGSPPRGLATSASRSFHRRSSSPATSRFSGFDRIVLSAGTRCFVAYLFQRELGVPTPRISSVNQLTSSTSVDPSPQRPNSATCAPIVCRSIGGIGCQLPQNA